MKEMMLDLETLDTKPSAVVLSIGAVVFETAEKPLLPAEYVDWTKAGRPITLDYEVKDRFYRILDIEEQLGPLMRTVSQSTLLWWNKQDQDAKDEAFGPNRVDVWEVMNQLQAFVDNHTVTTRDYTDVDPNRKVMLPVDTFQKINKFWASPVGFDYGIWNHLADDIEHDTPWRYNNVFDVRTAINEASYSAKDHVLSRKIPGKPHMPVYDCEVQIDELIAARNKVARRIGS